MPFWWTILRRKRWQSQSQWIRGEDGDEVEDEADDRKKLREYIQQFILYVSIGGIRQFECSIWGCCCVIVDGEKRKSNASFACKTRKQKFSCPLREIEPGACLF
mmetsp:Transcript_13956/g.35074  ORF Transcript_13956/g.35074 Transcript_13956/m.35074 type:complete len:104 (-) Transcript_13956:157-468(-)